MKLITQKSTLKGTARIPGSKSHTIRAIAFASLATSTSKIYSPLISNDTQSAIDLYTSLGAEIKQEQIENVTIWIIKGFAGSPALPDNIIDVKNSGTTLRIGLGSACLIEKGYTILTGDEQIRKRPSGPLIKSLNDLGATVFSSRENDLPPFIVKGKLKGGTTSLEAVSSQYLSSLLINSPFAEGDTEINVTLLNEKPYVEMTLDWLNRMTIKYDSSPDLMHFKIPGGQKINGFEYTVPSDWSSATFFLCAACLCGENVTIEGLDINDTQGDKAVLNYLMQMGADIKTEADRIIINRSELKGVELDLNATPDALPALTVTACFANGKSKFYNVPQARIKETDRITVMKEELTKLGGKVNELPDGLEVEGTELTGGIVDGRKDHRVIMALSIAGLLTDEPVTVTNADAVSVTFPEFPTLMQSLGANLQVETS